MGIDNKRKYIIYIKYLQSDDFKKLVKVWDEKEMQYAK